MIEQGMRRYYQGILVDPVAYKLKNHLSPNSITYLSGLLGILVLPALLLKETSLAILFLLLSGYCDTLDGTIARFTQQNTAWGTVLDIVMDRLVELTVVLALWGVAPESRGLGCLLMLSSMLLCITSFLVVGIFTENTTHKSFYYSPGIMERAEAFVFFILMMLWGNLFCYLSLLFTLLVFATAIIRLWQFYKQTIKKCCIFKG